MTALAIPLLSGAGIGLIGLLVIVIIVFLVLRIL